MKRSFLYLSVLTLLALLALWVFSPRDNSAGKPAADNLFLPAISKQINQVDRLEIVSAGNSTVATLLKTDSGWQIEQMDGYRADWPRIQVLLAALAQAKVVEPKTDNPEYYPRLGVEDVASGEARSVLVKVSIGDQTTGILIGHQAQGRQGQYVRLQNVAASVLVDSKLDVSTEQVDWADSTIIDINASEVAEVEIIHPQGDRLLVTRASADQTDFDLIDIPPEREIKNSWSVNSLGSVFSMLNMETVRPVDSVDWSAAIKMRLLMFSGVEVVADLVTAGEQHLLRLSASHPAANVTLAAEDNGQDSPEQQEIKKQAAEDVAKQLEDINQKVAGWAYGITKLKYDAMVRKPEELLKPLESS